MNYKKVFIKTTYILGFLLVFTLFAEDANAGTLQRITTNCQCGTYLRLHAEFSGTPNSNENYTVNSQFDLQNNPSCPANPQDTDSTTVPIQHPVYNESGGIDHWEDGYDANGRGWMHSWTNYYPGECVWNEYTSWVIKDSSGNVIKSGDTSEVCSDCKNSAPTCNPPIPDPQKDTYKPGETILMQSDASDPDNDSLSYEWSSSTGSLESPKAEDTNYTFPNSYGVSTTIKYKVTDTYGASAECQTTLKTEDEPPAVCGDGIVNGSEECDEGENNGNKCTPPPNGTCTYCSNSCQIITVNSEGPTPYCGDGVVNNDEVCDNGELNGVPCNAEYGQTCEYCNSDCSKLITINGGYCGDNYVDTPQEECDNGSNNGVECVPDKGSSCVYCSSTCTEETVTSNPNAASCNEACTDNSDCDAGLICSDFVCRNSSCIYDTDCVCDNSGVNTQITVYTNRASDNTCTNDDSRLDKVLVTLQSSSDPNNRYELYSTGGSAVFEKVPYDTYTITAKKEGFTSCVPSKSVTVDKDNLKQEENMSLFKANPYAWLYCKQGNFTMLSDLSEKMSADGNLIEDEGTVMVNGSIDLKDGNFGNSAYVFTPYDNSDSEFFSTVFNKINKSTQNIYFVSGDYEIKNSDANNGVFDLPGGRIVLVVGGNLAIDYGIKEINSSIIVNKNVIFKSEDVSDPNIIDEDLVINGNLLVSGNIMQERKSKIEVVGTYSFLNLDEDFDFNIFREYRRYTN